MDFIRIGSTDLYRSATPRLYKEQQNPRSITVGLLLTSTFISHSQLPSHTTSTTCYFTPRQHSATEVCLSMEWKGKSQMTGTPDVWATWGLTITEQCAYKPVLNCYVWPSLSFGMVGLGFSSVPSFCLIWWWEVNTTENCWMKWEKDKEIRVIAPGSVCQRVPMAKTSATLCPRRMYLRYLESGSSSLTKKSLHSPPHLRFA